MIGAIMRLVCLQFVLVQGERVPIREPYVGTYQLTPAECEEVRRTMEQDPELHFSKCECKLEA